MPDFIDVKVRVRKEKLGDLMYALFANIPYANVTGMNLVKKDMELTPVSMPQERVLPAVKKGATKLKLTKQQQEVITAVRNSNLTVKGITLVTERKIRAVTRIVNYLRKRGILAGRDGSLSINEDML